MLPSVTKPKREFIRVEDQSASNFSYHFQELDILSKGIWTILPWVFSSLNHINEVSPTLQINHFQKVDDSWISSNPLSFWKMWDCDDSLSVTEQAWRERGLSRNIYPAWNLNRIKRVSGNRFRARRIYFLASKWETYSGISITCTHYGNK